MLTHWYFIYFFYMLSWYIFCGIPW